MAPCYKQKLDPLPALQGSRVYNKTEYPIFHKMNVLFCSVDVKECRKMVAHLERVTRKLVKMMAEDEMFEAMFERYNYIGSYYEGTRVSEPTEFDLLIVFKLPFDEDKIQVINDSDTIKGCAKVVLPTVDDGEVAAKFHRLLNWNDDDNCLDQNQFRNWAKGVLQKALNQLSLVDSVYILKINNLSYNIRVSESGPALTLKVECDERVAFDLDLVPAFGFASSNRPDGGFCELDERVPTWYTIAKPLKGVHEDADERVRNRSWRVVFPDNEKAMLNDKFHLKNMVRIVKKLRDTQKFNSLASYYIKTAFLWENEERGEDFWRRPMGFILVHMLKRLHFYLDRLNLPNFWYQNQNLFDSIPDTTLTDMANRLKRIIDDIETRFSGDNLVMTKYILNQEEQVELFCSISVDRKLANELKKLKI